MFGFYKCEITYQQLAHSIDVRVCAYASPLKAARTVYLIQCRLIHVDSGNCSFCALKKTTDPLIFFSISKGSCMNWMKPG